MRGRTLDPQTIRRLIDELEWSPSESPDVEERCIYLGTVFSLTPSGKFYAPWACSNITEEEALEDERWREQAEAELESVGLHLENGESDPCDLFAVEYRDTE